MAQEDYVDTIRTFEAALRRERLDLAWQRVGYRESSYSLMSVVM
jgi:hypothetical protein